MRLHILSDLHLAHRPLASAAVVGDVLVLAGDISDGDLTRTVGFASAYRRARRPVIYVAGNHEFYGHNLAQELRALCVACRQSGIEFLHDRAVVLDGVRFVGGTLWTDFRFRPWRQRMGEALLMAQADMPDYREIGFGARHLKPLDTVRFHERTRAFLERTFAVPHAGPSVLVTHHAPHRNSVAPRFADSPINSCYVSDLEPELQRWRPVLATHGHVHDRFDYRIGPTRVVTNPRGYFQRFRVQSRTVDVPENPRFDPDFVVDL